MCTSAKMRVCNRSMAWFPRISSAKNKAELAITAMSPRIMPLSVIRWITKGCKNPITVDTASVSPTTRKDRL